MSTQESGEGRRRKSRLLLLTTLVLTCALLIAACGDSGDSTTTASGSGAGGEATLTQTSQPDFLDPALSYTVNGWEPMWIVYTPLLTYNHEEGESGSELVPGLAEALPEVSEDSLTYTFKLRDGLTYSDGQDVVASDFSHTIKRVLNLGSGGAPFYEGIVGAKQYEGQDNPDADIKGIKTDDATGEIEITLEAPDASFSNVLAMNFAGLVPGDTPFKNMTESPPAGVGPYVITESVPNRQFVMERRQDFGDLGIDVVPNGHIDTLTTKIVKSASKQAQDVLDNQTDYMQDPPPADLKPTVTEQVGEGTSDQRYAEFTTLSTYYFFMNHEVAPFDDPKVREAVNIGIDKPALARLFAGELAPGCTFLPPGFPGYDEALDVVDCPWGDPNVSPQVEKAQALIKEAGASGADVTVWGNNDDPTDKVTQAYADQLNTLGLNTEVKILDGGVYFQTIGDQSTEAQTGFTNWFADFPHPLNFYFLVDGDTIQPQNNQNFGNVDDPKINDEIDALSEEPDVQAVADRWAALDKYLVDSAAIAPYGHRKLATFVSDRIDFNAVVVNPLYQNDYTSFQFKDGQ